MIVESIFNVFYTVVYSIISVLPTIPGGDLGDSVGDFFNLIFSNLDLLTIFIRPTTFQIIIPLFLGIMYFEEIYYIILWCLQKIPVIDID